MKNYLKYASIIIPVAFYSEIAALLVSRYYPGSYIMEVTPESFNAWYGIKTTMPRFWILRSAEDQEYCEGGYFY